LTKRFANSQAAYESFEDNKFLPLFYEEYKKKGPVWNKYAFPMTMWFLKSRFEREDSLTDKKKCYIIDRGIIEDRHIFAQNYIQSGILSQEEATEYYAVFNKCNKKVGHPDVYVYVRANVDTLMQRYRFLPLPGFYFFDVFFNLAHKLRIETRARGMETGVERSYIEDLQKLYEGSLQTAIASTEVDFVTIESDFMEETAVADKVYKDVYDLKREFA
jgi:deoxyadenosine/deoxycytidine kinase